DHHVMDVAAHQYIAVTVGRRHRVVVEPVAHQRQRGDARPELLASVIRWRKRLRKGSQIALQPLADRLAVTAQTIAHALSATVQKMGVECLEACEDRDRHQEVPPCVTDKPFDFALVVAFAWAAEPVLEQIVRLQLVEHARPLPLAITKNARHRDLGVVIQDRLRYPAKECERLNVAVANASVVSAGYATTKPASECGRSNAKKWSLRSTPPMTPIASPKSACASPGGGP